MVTEGAGTRQNGNDQYRSTVIIPIPELRPQRKRADAALRRPNRPKLDTMTSRRRSPSGGLPSGTRPDGPVPRGWLRGEFSGTGPPMRCCPSGGPDDAQEAADAARERLRSASLDSTDQTEPEPLTECPRSGGRVVIELHSGSVIPDRCRANTCAYCLPLNARRRCLAITYAQPQRMITLTLMANEDDEYPHKAARTRIGLVSRNLKRFGRVPGQWTWTLEQNPKGTGYHAHCLQRGPSIPQEELQEASIRAGGGIAYIEKIKRTGIWTSRYGLKGFGADGYGLKSFAPKGNSREALRINGGKLEHHSRSFFAIDGDAIPVRLMESLAIVEMNGGGRTAYVGAAATEADRILGNEDIRSSLVRDIDRRNTAKLRAYAYYPAKTPPSRR